MKIGWIVLGVVLLGLGWFSHQPLPWPWWQVLLNPLLWAVATVKEFLEPWWFFLMLGGGASAAYGLLSSGKKKR